VLGISVIQKGDGSDEAKKKAEEEANKASDQSGGKSGGDPLISKSEMRSEMRSMIQELLEIGMIGPRVALELIPNDVKLEGSKNYLS
jgi:hypothetical protein